MSAQTYGKIIKYLAMLAKIDQEIDNEN